MFKGVIIAIVLALTNWYKKIKLKSTSNAVIQPETPNKPTEVQEVNQPVQDIKVEVEKVEVKTEVKVEAKVDTTKVEPKAQFLLERTTFTEKTTIGRLLLNGKFICYTLEDKDRKLEKGGTKIFGETAIPRGTYEIQITWSNRFKKAMPLLLRVPQFQGIRIHAGNSQESTHGCVLLGYGKQVDRITESLIATQYVYDLIENMLKKERVYIQIK